MELKWQNNKVLITGAAGFIGSHLTIRMLDMNADVVILDNLSTGNVKNIPEKINIIKGDVRDRKTLDEINNVDYVFHFGSPSSVILFNKDPIECVNNTICGFLNIIEWVKDNKVKKMIYPSSGSVYGDSSITQSEDTNVQPNNLYGISKLTCEHIARLYYEQVPTVGLRIFAGYGPGEDLKGQYASVITLFINSILKNKRPEVYGSGLQSRDFIYIDDVVEAIIKAAEKNVSKVINVGTGKTYTFNEIITMINYLLNKNIKPLYIKKPLNYLNKTEASITKMKNELGINPKNLEEGLKKYLSIYTQNKLSKSI